jgi:hypothetical protein
MMSSRHTYYLGMTNEETIDWYLVLTLRLMNFSFLLQLR